MKTTDFDFSLPDELIAQYPLPNRTSSRLLHYHQSTKSIDHLFFYELSNRLNPGDLLVMNNTKVIPARFYGRKSSGGRVEILIERLLTERSFLAHIKASKSPKPNTVIALDQSWEIVVRAKQHDLYHCELLSPGSLDDMLAAIGHIPLPLYISREDQKSDAERYQTVYAKHNGSVAAPTAGLHFDHLLLNQLQAQGIGIAYVTLHIGAGTFQPVRVDHVKEHRMHSEYFELSQATCDLILKTKAEGNRVIAVGTTSMRTLESAALNGTLKAQSMDTDIFIYPGFDFKVCDGLITNFHLPQSTLIMLVAAFIGHEETMALYQEAISNQYRFYSYGDACLLL